MGAKRGTPAERLWRAVRRGKPDECWEWMKFVNSHGYGMLAILTVKGRRPILAHRLSWIISHGDPGTLCVLHKCDNRKCVNPAHLFLGTRPDNTRDMIAKGRQKWPQFRPFCKRGHSMTGNNIGSSGKERRCRACACFHAKRYRQMRKTGRYIPL